MVQMKKADIELKILVAAKNEFLRVGFQESKVRKIASQAQVSTSNLYSYFSNKDDLFAATTHKVRSDLLGLNEMFRRYRPSEVNLDSLPIEIERSLSAINYIRLHRIELHLLLNQSQGSKLAQFSDILVNGYVENCLGHIVYLKKNGCPIARVPSEFFFRSVANMFLYSVKEILRSDVSLPKAKRFAEEITRYNFFGFRGMSKNDF
jgi:AcrR family transcriptional regulator